MGSAAMVDSLFLGVNCVNLEPLFRGSAYPENLTSIDMPRYPHFVRNLKYTLVTA
jgi:hypothetical protein